MEVKSHHSGKESARKSHNASKNAKAQTIVKMSGKKGETREVYQPVKNAVDLDEVKSRSEPQKKPQVRDMLAETYFSTLRSYTVCNYGQNPDLFIRKRCIFSYFELLQWKNVLITRL